MKAGILGKKLGMTQIFTEEGEFVPVTVIEAGPCTILKVLKNKVMLGFGVKKEKNTPKPELGFYKKLDVKPSAFVKELAFDVNDKISAGQQLTLDIFKEKDFVDVTGTSIGKGFQGGMKRWGWSGGPDGHGSMHHRRVGSIGGSSYPSRVWKGLHLPGRMGNKKKTTQNLEIVKIVKDKNMLLVKGPVPGADNGYLEIRLAKKKPVVRGKEEANGKGKK
ncbi:MAG: 50S ribosomal protein L3 [Candidatus Omnitrophica bacterium]|nr:50S ribosomal protein L3 [Candidatus Omnitrophota bacterium]MBU4589405.1 50S ribosomal protein L3 [Candidatus Omnitrophota bacterium]